MRMSNNQKRT